MTDLERMELAVWRTKEYFAKSGDHQLAGLCNVLAGEIMKAVQDSRKSNT